MEVFAVAGVRRPEAACPRRYASASDASEALSEWNSRLNHIYRLAIKI